MIAAIFGCSKSNASKMMARFYEKLKKSVQKNFMFNLNFIKTIFHAILLICTVYRI